MLVPFSHTAITISSLGEKQSLARELLLNQ